MMKKWKRGFKWIAAIALAVLTVGSTIDTTTLVVSAVEEDVAENAVASVNDSDVTTNYDDFAKALSAWTDGTTLTLLSEITATDTVELSGKSVTLDLNGYTYSGNRRLFTVKEGAALTITDNSGDADGVLECTATGNYAIANEGTVTVAGGTLTFSTENYETILNYGLINITGGKVENTQNYVIDNQRGTVNITGGTIYGAKWGIINWDTLIVSGEPNMSSELDFLWGDGTIDLSGATNADGWTIKNGVHDNAVVGTNLILPEGLELQVDNNKVDELVPGVTATLSHPHTGGTATCTEKAICDICEEPYGKLFPHDFDSEGICTVCETEATITVTAGTAVGFASDGDSLNAVFTEFLEEGETDITVNLPADAEAKLFTAIRRALIDTGVPDRSINLTLAGVTSIPDHDECSPMTAIFGEILGEKIEEVTQLKSVSLPDAISIGASSFGYCGLTTINVPKVQTVGEKAFWCSGLITVELPEATTLEYAAFYSCESLTSIKLPKVTNLEQQALDLGVPTSEVNVYLTAEGDITINEDCFYHLERLGELSTKVNLVLNCDKKDAVTVNDDGTATWKDFTFKSITYWHADWESNDNGTHSKICACGEYNASENCIGGIYCVDDSTIVDHCELCEAELGRASLNVAGGVYNGTAYEASVESNGSLADVAWPITYKKGDATLEAAPADAGTYTAAITYEDTTASVEFTIKQATPVIGTVSADSLEDTLDAEAVVLKRTDETIAGTLALTDSELQYGTHTYNWKFTPADTINYETITGTVEITVTEDPLKAFVKRMYTVALSREAEADGVAFWVDLLKTGKNDGEDIAKSFFNGEEFVGKNLSNEDYLEVLYATFFDREADEEGWDYNMSLLENNVSRDAVLDVFINSTEFTAICDSYGIKAVFTKEEQVRSFVERMYTVALNRTADVADVTYWVGLLLGGDSDGEDIAVGFFNGTEFVGRNLSDEDYLEVLYATFFDREADEEGWNYNMSLLQNGVSREDVLAGFINSSEFDALCTKFGIEAVYTQEELVRKFVDRMYTSALGRASEEEGAAYWTAQLLAGNITGAKLADDFISGDEFVNRGLSDREYVEVLYATFFNREGAEADIEYWMGVAANNRRTVLVGFASSEEFATLCDKYEIVVGEIK